MRVALAQINSVTGDLEGNAERLVGAIRRAREHGCDLVVAPETALTGYACADLLEIDAFVRENKALLTQKVAPEVHGMAAVVGFVDFEEQSGAIARRYSAAAAIQDGRILAVGRKQNLCKHRYYDEPRHFAPGARTEMADFVLDGRPLRVALLLCEDMWDGRYAQKPVEDAARRGADVLAVLNASPFDAGKHDRRAARIAEIQAARPLPVLYATNTGIGDTLKNVLVFDGRSMAFDAAGRLVACGAAFAEDLVVFDLNEDLRGEPITEPTWEDEEELLDALAFALRQYAAQTGFTRALLGVSGGVDSALCAALAVEALGTENVLGVSMPSRYSSQETQADARAVCNNLGIECAVLPIDEMCAQALDSLSSCCKVQDDLTRQNLQSRARGVLLMALSNEQRRLLIAAGNKTELALGYCTLYGDTAGGIALIGDVNKMQVYRLAEYVNRRAGREVIPASVLRRAPSAELTDGQKDPFDYPVVAPMVDDLIARLDPATLMARFRERALGERYPHDVHKKYDEATFATLLADTWELFVRSAFKRAQTAPVVVVSGRALGPDLRETLLNRWRPDQGF